MKKLILIISLFAFISVCATAQNTYNSSYRYRQHKIAQQKRYASSRPIHATKNDINIRHINNNNYPQNVPNTDNKELNKNIVKDVFAPDNGHTGQSQPNRK